MATDGGLIGYRFRVDPRKSMNKKQRRAFYHGGSSFNKKSKRK